MICKAPAPEAPQLRGLDVRCRLPAGHDGPHRGTFVADWCIEWQEGARHNPPASRYRRRPDWLEDLYRRGRVYGG